MSPRLWTPQEWDALPARARASVLELDWNALTTRERIALFGLSGGAGNYTDLPDHRIEYDRDGTAGLRINPDNTITELSGAQMQNMNDEDADAGVGAQAAGASTRWAFVFPDLRDIVAYYANMADGTPGSLERSTNSTNGLDGTWASVVNPWTRDGGSQKPNYRTSIQTVSINAQKAVRFNVTASSNLSGFRALHLYGKRSAVATQYLTLWRPNTAAGSEPTGDSRATSAHFDWGDVPRSSSADRKFRVKNEHGTLTANDVTITIEALTDTTPSVPGQFLFSDDGVNFAASLNIGNLAPGALSADLWVRRTTPSNASLSVWSARILAEADGGWS